MGKRSSSKRAEDDQESDGIEINLDSEGSDDGAANMKRQKPNSAGEKDGPAKQGT